MNTFFIWTDGRFLKLSSNVPDGWKLKAARCGASVCYNFNVNYNFKFPAVDCCEVTMAALRYECMNGVTVTCIIWRSSCFKYLCILSFCVHTYIHTLYRMCGVLHIAVVWSWHFRQRSTRSVARCKCLNVNEKKQIKYKYIAWSGTRAPACASPSCTVRSKSCGVFTCRLSFVMHKIFYY